MDDGPEDGFNVEAFGGLIIVAAIASYRSALHELNNMLGNLDDNGFALSVAKNALRVLLMDVVNCAASNAADQGEE